MILKSFQDYYPDHFSHCYGCGRLNEYGLKIKSYWDDENTICRFNPKPYHIALPGYVYGGLLASIIDCHGVGSAAAAIYKSEHREMGTEPAIRCLTGSLKIMYIKPTPIDREIILKGIIKEVQGKKVIVEVHLSVEDDICVNGEVIAIRIPDNYLNIK